MEQQQQLPSTFNFMQKALKKVELEAKNCKYIKVVDNLEGAFAHAIKEAQNGNNNAAWPPLRLCLGSNSSKLLIVTLDTVTKLCAHGIFQDEYCDNLLPTASGSPPIEQQRNSDFPEVEENLPPQISQTLAEDIVTTVCSCKTEDEAIRLQLIRVILTVVSCASLEVHESYLLKSVGALFSIYLATQSAVNRGTAKASLQQLFSYVFSRMELAQIDLNGSAASSGEEASKPHAEDESSTVVGVEEEQKDLSSSTLPHVRNSWPSLSQCPYSMYRPIFHALQLENYVIPPPSPPPTRRLVWDHLMKPTGNFPTVLHKDAHLIFHALCKASSKNVVSTFRSRSSTSPGALEEGQRDGGSSSNMDARFARKMLSLELLLSLIERSGPAFRTSDRFVTAVTRMLCGSILKNCTSNETPVVELSLRIFLVLCRDFKKCLKAEIEIFITKIFLKILLSPLSPYEHKALVLDLVCTLCSSTQTLIEVFINYDCDPKAVNLYAQIVESVSKMAKGPGIGMGGRESTGGPTANGPSFREETFQLQNLALDALVRILTSLLHALGETTTQNDETESIGSNGENEEDGMRSNNEASSAADDEVLYDETDELDTALQVAEHPQQQHGHHHGHGKKKVHEQISSRLWKFNVNPVLEVESLQACGAIGETPADVARFLHSWSGKLDKTAIGDYLCFDKGGPKGGGVNTFVLNEYVDQMDFSGLHFCDAIFLYLSGFRLSGEDKVERMMKKFAERYCQQNPTVFQSEERAFLLANAVVFLHIELHNSVRIQWWTAERFINENKGKEEEGGGGLLGGTADAETSYLSDMFNRIKRDPITVVTPSSRTSTSVIHAYDRKKKMDEQLSNGILRFNLSSTKGVDRLQACGAIGETPADVARFLHSWSEKLDKTAIGDYLSREKEYKGGFNVLVLHEYVDQINFSGLRFDYAIRHYLSGFRLPGEAQKIDRMMEKFAERYCLQNPAVFPSADTAFILAFSIIMLNTDLHNPAIKEDRRMTVEGFIGNNRGIGDGNNLDETFLRDIFDSIKTDPIHLKEDDRIREQLVGNDTSYGLGQYIVYGLIGMTSTADRAKRQAAYDKERVDMLRSSQALVRMRRQEKVHVTEDPIFSHEPSGAGVTLGAASDGMICDDGGLSATAAVQEDTTTTGKEGDNNNKFMVSGMALSETDALAYVRAMFEVAWWPMVGAFSQVLEECCGGSIGELSSPEGVGGVMVQHCLGGCRLGLRLSARCIGSFLTSMPSASLPPSSIDGDGGDGEAPRPLVTNISREAFMNMIGKFTLLDPMWGNGTYSSIQEMHPHHLRCIHTLLVIALEDGDYLEESWGVVLRLLSQLARLLILAEGLAADGDFFEPSQELSLEQKGSLGLSIRRPSSKRTLRRSSSKILGARWQMSNATLVKGAISMGLIDRIFTNSINLNTPGIQHLVNQLCYMSQLELSPESSVVLPIVKNGVDNSSSSMIQPRIFSLQKLVEVADFNMDVRGRLVWAGIWEKLSGHFSEIGAHENPHLAMYAIDSLRQLAVKFMVKEELRDFNFQRVVLRPFEAITAKGSCTETHVVFILHCIEQLVQARGKNIRSGWKSVLAVLSTAIRGWSSTTTKLAWGILQKIVEHEFSALSCDFLDVTKCLLAVVQREDSQELSLLAVDSLSHCAGFLGRGKKEKLKEVVQEKENWGGESLKILTPPPHPHLFDRSKSYSERTPAKVYKEIERIANASSGSLPNASEEVHLCLWWPLLFGLSESVEDERIEVRHACLEALTSTLEKFGSCFSTQTWLLLLKAILFPIFESAATDLVDQPSSLLPTDVTFPPSSASAEPADNRETGTGTASSHNIVDAYSSSWTAVTAPLSLQMCCRLLIAHPDRLFPLFFELLGIYKRCICQEREGLARIGVQGLIYLIEELENKCPDAMVERDEGKITMTVWNCITDFLIDIMKCNFPTDLLEGATIFPSSSSPSSVLSSEELEEVKATVKPSGRLMTIMVISHKLVLAVRDMLLRFGRKGSISLFGVDNVKRLMQIMSESTTVYSAFNDCLPIRICLAQDEFVLHPDGMKKGYFRTADLECNGWIAKLHIATLLGLGVNLESGENLKDPPGLEVAYNEISHIFTSIISCYCRRQDALVGETASEREGLHVLIMRENMELMTPAVIEALKMLRHLSDSQLQKNISWIYSTLVRLIRSDSILIRDAVHETMSNRVQTFIQMISTVPARPPPQSVVQ